MAIHGQAGTIRVVNAMAGWKELLAHLARHAVGRVGIEATGGYERGVVRHLQAAGMAVILFALCPAERDF